MNDLNRAQRIVLVIGWAAVLWAFGMWATNPAIGVGSFSFAGVGTFVSSTGLAPWERMFVWWALTATWTAGALWAFGSFRWPRALSSRLPDQGKQDGEHTVPDNS